MSRDLNDLVPEFREQAETLLATCGGAGIQMRPFFTLRRPDEQAKLWRQSRSKAEIDAAVARLNAAGASFLARVIEEVGPQFGNPVTNALPGLSWHQWGEAVDCFWLLDGKAEWSTRRKERLPDGREINAYQLYAETARDMGLQAGGFWSRFKDWPHVQLRSEGSPQRLFSLADIDQQMRNRFA